jgi:hypothetical protein
MAHFVGVAIAAGAIQMPARRHPRGPNKHRQPSRSDEDAITFSRLSSININQITLEYDNWRRAHYQINPQLQQSETNLN